MGGRRGQRAASPGAPAHNPREHPPHPACRPDTRSGWPTSEGGPAAPDPWLRHVEARVGAPARHLVGRAVLWGPAVGQRWALVLLEGGRRGRGLRAGPEGPLLPAVLQTRQAPSCRPASGPALPSAPHALLAAQVRSQPRAIRGSSLTIKGAPASDLGRVTGLPWASLWLTVVSPVQGPARATRWNILAPLALTSSWPAPRRLAPTPASPGPSMGYATLPPPERAPALRTAPRGPQAAGVGHHSHGDARLQVWFLTVGVEGRVKDSGAVIPRGGSGPGHACHRGMEPWST